jgi:hypothetical protein
MMPLQMTPERLKKKILAQPPKSPLSGAGGKKPIPVNKRVHEKDLGDELSGYGLQGVKVTDDELLDLVKNLGLDDDAAGDLVKGLGGSEGKDDKEGDVQHSLEPKAEEKEVEEEKEEVENQKEDKKQSS